MTTTPKSVREYLDALTWDGQPRIDRWLVDYAGAEDTAYVRAVGRATLVAAVRRARHPGCRADEMLVIQGPQGTEKSAALRVLAIEDAWFTDDLPVSGSSQAIIEATHGKWIVELSELRGMGPGDAAALKALLSAREDVPKRQAYQRVPERVPRAFMIVGTTSETEYLHDPTGNRRFWSVRIERFDVARLRADRDQLWAEAAAAEASGEQVRVPSDASHEERIAYVVINDQVGPEFSSGNLDAACTFVADKLRKQVDETLTNPPSYHIKRVPSV